MAKRKIIDIHAHTTSHKLWGLPTESATIEDLEELARLYNVEKICLMATYFPFKGSGLHNRELLKRIEGKELFSMFASLDAMNNLAGGIEELESLAKGKLIAGIKLYPGYQDFNFADEKAFPIYELAEKFNLPVMFHGGYLHHCCPEEKRLAGETRCGKTCKMDQLQYLSRPETLRKVFEKFSSVRFCISHLANPYFGELIAVMKECQNVYTDISGSDIDIPEYRPIVAEVVKAIMRLAEGENRIMFGTDFPIQSYEDTIQFVESLQLSDEVKQKIYWQNAERYLKGHGFVKLSMTT